MNAYKSLKKIAEKYKLLLTIENVACNHEDPLTHFKELYQVDGKIAFTYDTKMAAFHHQVDEVYKTNGLGYGRKNIFDTFFKFLKKVDYKEDFTVEATSFDREGNLYFDKINQSIHAIRTRI